MATVLDCRQIESPTRAKALGTVHIRRPYGTSAICGVSRPHFHGGPATATCLRCLAHPISRDWGKDTGHVAAKPVAGCWCEVCTDGRYRKAMAINKAAAIERRV